MKLKLGHTYETRDGRAEYRVIEIVATASVPYPVIGLLVYGDRSYYAGRVSFMVDGRSLSIKQSRDDLVKDVTEKKAKKPKAKKEPEVVKPSVKVGDILHCVNLIDVATVIDTRRNGNLVLRRSDNTYYEVNSNGVPIRCQLAVNIPK